MPSLENLIDTVDLAKDMVSDIATDPGLIQEIPSATKDVVVARALSPLDDLFAFIKSAFVRSLLALTGLSLLIVGLVGLVRAR